MTALPALPPLTRPQAKATAQRMYESGGWTITGICEYLAGRGVDVGWEAVKAWTDPAWAEQRRAAQREYQRRWWRDRHQVADIRVGDADGVLRRIIALHRARLSVPSIAKVIALDFGVVLSRGTISHAISKRELPPLARRRLKTGKPC
jgi:hypothetical protein